MAPCGQLARARTFSHSSVRFSSFSLWPFSLLPSNALPSNAFQPILLLRDKSDEPSNEFHIVFIANCGANCGAKVASAALVQLGPVNKERPKEKP